MKILFAGGDVRMIYAAERLSGKYEVSAFCSGETAFPKPHGIYDAIVLPLPLTKDGKNVFAPRASEAVPFGRLKEFADESTLVLAGGRNDILSRVCEERGCKLADYFSDEALTLKNAALTAEAAVALLITSSDGALLGSSALITGSGRIAGFLAERLRPLGCKVTLAARNADKRAAAELNGFETLTLENALESISGYDYIANTIPAPLFKEREFSLMKKTAVFEELASLPEQPAADLAKRNGIKYIYASGLPGKYSAKTAGGFIADTLEKIIKEYSDSKFKE